MPEIPRPNGDIMMRHLESAIAALGNVRSIVTDTLEEMPTSAVAWAKALGRVARQVEIARQNVQAAEEIRRANSKRVKARRARKSSNGVVRELEQER